MKILKWILIALGALIALVLIIALFVNKGYSVHREIVIDKPKQEVFNYIKHLKNQDYYSPWATRDPKMQKTYSGTDGTPGFVSAWNSQVEKVGQGEQEIKQVVEGERIDYELRFIKPFESTEHAYMITEAIAENQTKVVWGFDGHMAYPFNIWLLFLDFDSMIGGDLEAGLQGLKTVMDSAE